MQTKKNAKINIIISLIILGIVFVLLIFAIINNFWGAFSHIRPFYYQENTQYIRNFCIDACNTQNSEKYCDEIKELKLGDQKLIQGNCDALSKIFIKGFEQGIEKCPKINCQNTEPATCYKERKKINCEELG